MKEKLIQHFQQTSLTIQQNEIQAIRRKNITKTACRIYDNGKIGIAGSIGDANEKELFERAERNLAYDIEYPVEPTKNTKSKVVIDECQITDSELCGDVERILGEVARLHPDFTVSHKANLNEFHISMENECGLDLNYSDKSISLSLLLRKKGSSDIMNTAFGITTRKLDTDKIIQACSNHIKAYSTMLPFPKEPLPIIVQDSVVVPIFQRNLSAKLLGTGSSLFQAQMKKEIFNSNFSLKIENDPIKTFAPAFDMEGTITPENLSYLIQNGTLLRPYSDKRTSLMYGYENTGCASGAYDSVPTLGGANACVVPGEKTLKELLDGKLGLLVMFAGGGDFTADGEYASPVQLAYLTDGEKFLGRVPEFTIKASIYDIFGKDFIGMSSDKIFAHDDERMFVTRMNIEQL